MSVIQSWLKMQTYKHDEEKKKITVIYCYYVFQLVKNKKKTHLKPKKTVKTQKIQTKKYGLPKPRFHIYFATLLSLTLSLLNSLDFFFFCFLFAFFYYFWHRTKNFQRQSKYRLSTQCINVIAFLFFFVFSFGYLNILNV